MVTLVLLLPSGPKNTPQDFDPGLPESKIQVPNTDLFSPYWGKTCFQWRLAFVEMRGVEKGTAVGEVTGNQI